MTILQKGNLDLLKAVMRFKCYNCGCLWEADNSEYQTHGVAITCKCPICENRCPASQEEPQYG